MIAPSQTSRTSPSKDGRTVTVHIPVTFRQRAGRKQILSPSGSAQWLSAPRVDTALLKAVARAFRWREMLDNGSYATIRETAAAENINESYVSRVLRLALLAPAIVQLIVEGRQPAAVSLAMLLMPFPVCWQDQERWLASC